MKELQERILKEGKVIGDEILNVDTFINYQVDPILMEHIGKELAAKFSDCGITKVMTVESSGISPALMVAKELGVPMVILKKGASKVFSNEIYHTEVTAFTTGKNYDLCLSADVISDNDHVLLVDDFLADGESMTGAIRLLRLAHATVAGVGIVIEKSFQPGRDKLKAQGIEVHSLVRIKQMDDIQITFIDD